MKTSFDIHCVLRNALPNYLFMIMYIFVTQISIEMVIYLVVGWLVKLYSLVVKTCLECDVTWKTKYDCMKVTKYLSGQ